MFCGPFDAFLLYLYMNNYTTTSCLLVGQSSMPSGERGGRSEEYGAEHDFACGEICTDILDTSLFSHF